MIEINNLFDEAIKFENSKKYKDASECYRIILDIDPHNLRSIISLGLILFELKFYDESIQYFDEALEIDCNESLAHYLKGAALFMLGYLDDAMECMLFASKLSPNNNNIQFHTSLILLYKYKFKESLLLINELIDIEPDNKFYNNLKNNIVNMIKRYDHSIQKGYNNNIRQLMR